MDASCRPGEVWSGVIVRMERPGDPASTRELTIALYRARELARAAGRAVEDAVDQFGVHGGDIEDARALVDELAGALGLAGEIVGDLVSEIAGGLAEAADRPDPTAWDPFRALDDARALDGDLDDVYALTRDLGRALARAMVSPFARSRIPVFARELNHAMERALAGANLNTDLADAID